MKAILLVTIFLVNFRLPFVSSYCNKDFSIKVWDYNYSMAYTTLYSLNNKAITVKFINGLQNGKDSVLLRRSLSDSECRIIFDFFASHDVNLLKNNYSNPLVDDGDRKRVILNIKGKSKTIEIANFYQKDMGELFDAINKIVNKGLQIKYKRPS
jgi:hypothetical protein